MSTTSAPPRQAGRADGSMSLLVDAVTGALDPGYADVSRARAARDRQRDAARQQAVAPPRSVAHRRATRPAGPPGPPAPVAVPAERPDWKVAPWVVLAVLGLLTGLAVAQVRHGQGDSVSARAGLAQDVRSQTRATDALNRQASQVRSQLTRTRADLLRADASLRAAQNQLQTLQTAAATTAVRGPGVVVTLTDAPGSDRAGTGRGGQVSDGRILDTDLQAVSNALWNAGAEAISINGQRLSAQTAIRSAGEAVLVDFRPLSSPYVVRAIGRAEQIEPAFADDPAVIELQVQAGLHDFTVGTARSRLLRLPAAELQALTHAVAATPADGSQGAQP